MNLLLKKKIIELRKEKMRLEKESLVRCEKNGIALEEQVNTSSLNEFGTVLSALETANAPSYDRRAR